jgi:hypothetical protein
MSRQQVIVAEVVHICLWTPQQLQHLPKKSPFLFPFTQFMLMPHFSFRSSSRLLLSTALLLTLEAFASSADRSLQSAVVRGDREIPISTRFPHAETFFFTTQSQQREYKCEGKIYCSEMTSCEEAKFYLKNCPGVKIDGDGDGIPCESQWCRS